MAPRTRSHREEKLARQKLLASGVPVNTRGLASLPNELYMEILNYLPTIPLPQDVWIDKKPDPYRQLTLYYLSQTCRSLRVFFLRYAWERIEVFGGMWTPTGRLATTAERNKRGVDMKELGDKKLVEEVLRQLETVTVRNPDLQQYVSIVNLNILKHSHDSVIPEVAQNLSLFPNLHTLQLIFRFYYNPSQPVFSAFRYRNVSTLTLSRLSPSSDIIPACPNIRHASFYKDVGNSYLVHMLLTHKCAGTIEKLGVRLAPGYPAASLVKSFPRLCDISLDCEEMRRGETFDFLSLLPLHTIRLRLDDFRPEYYPSLTPASPGERQYWVVWLKGVLAKCPQGTVAKKVIVVNDDKTVEVHDV